ncbi:unnamed protein product (macronuclear) [Paramecium tetraurelia]|uniref:Uncharacterized protein n=1 Tax=Paramecium tetraurelia TaxID=5888 RepID=A0E892_PARTE|nr:uncharacterized protein GSPATT00024237001 [Paramecium tetraurelia]CAK91509.1 unnamed protein product [Paramecium tetraurelia]|eukprot:XP_001458906.1 hypothetical protein (macronuclear) [Paramecium tetraurelia strain d4-2]
MGEQGIKTHNAAPPPTAKPGTPTAQPSTSSPQPPPQSNITNNSTTASNGPTKEQLEAANPARNIWQRLFGQLDSVQITAVMIVISSILLL